jgi:hypothetical protein
VSERISREELWEKVGAYDVEEYDSLQDDTLANIARALGYEVMEDKPPELPEGWQVEVEGDGERERVVLTIGTDDPWRFEASDEYGNCRYFKPILARALAALRQDDGEVELMVTWNQVRDLIQENWTSGISHPVGADNFLSELRLLAVRARRVRS